MCSDEEWQAALKDVQPLVTKPRIHDTDALLMQRKQVYVAPIQFGGYDAPAPVHTYDMPAKLEVFDHNTLKRIKSGRMPVERTLDLHGLGADMAYDTLHQFITNAYAAHCALVLVITGKGKLSSQGILKRSFIRWAEDATFRPMIVGVAQASKHHGGQGAFYVRLRRKR